MHRLVKWYPLRALAAFLLLVVAAEIWGICHTPTHEAELTEAMAAYSAAMAENRALRWALGK